MITVTLPRPVITIILSLPPKQLSANARRGSSRIAKSRLVKTYRKEASLLFRTAAQGRSFSSPAVASTFFWPNNLRRDKDNAAAMLKPVWDGLQDSGAIVNDSELTHMTPVFQLDRKNPRVEIDVFDVQIQFEVAGV